MADFQINLIRSRVLPRPRRRVVFMGMLLYLAACGVVLTFTAYATAEKFISALSQRDSLARLDERFREEYPSQKDVVTYEESLRQDMRKRMGALEAVDGILGAHYSLSGVLVWLLEPVPPDLYLLEFEYDGGASLVEFTLGVPINQRTKAFRSEELITKWKENSELSSRLTDIKLVANERQEVERAPTYVWKFSGRVIKGAK